MKENNEGCVGGAGIKWFTLLMLLITSSILNAAQFVLDVVDGDGIAGQAASATSCRKTPPSRWTRTILPPMPTTSCP